MAMASAMAWCHGPGAASNFTCAAVGGTGEVYSPIVCLCEIKHAVLHPSCQTAELYRDGVVPKLPLAHPGGEGPHGFVVAVQLQAFE